ncbi:MAG: type II secretion system F family protein [Candidatus Nitrosotenuis sp.]
MWVFIYLQNVTAFLVFVFIVVFFITIEEKGKLKRPSILIYRVKNKTRFLHHLAPHTQLKIVRPANSTIIALLKPVTEQKILAQIQTRLDSNLASQISRSGKAANPKILAQKTMTHTVFTLLITLPMSIIFGLWFDVMFFSLLAAPLFVFALPSLKLKWNQVERKAAIDDELSFFAVYCSVMQSVGRPIYDAILQSVGKRIFPIIESEGRMLERNVSLFGMDHLEAINTLALQHPNTAFRNLLLGYVSIQKSGGDLTRYLESKSQEFFSQTKFKFFKYASSAENIAEILLILLNILPILLIMSSFLMSHESVRIIVSLSFVAVPAITASLLIFVIGIQPKTHNIVVARMHPIPVAIASGLVAFFVVPQAWFVFAVMATAASLANFVELSRQFAQIRMVESALPDFFRDITECVKIGLDIPNSIIRISNERRYNRIFDTLVSNLASRVSFGEAISDAIQKTPISSWHARISLFILGKVVESGGGSPQILEAMTDFTAKINQAKSEMASRVRVFTLMVYSSPLLMVWSTQGMKDLLGKIGPQYSQMTQGFSSTLAASPDFLQLVNLLIVVSSFCMSLVISKLTYFTIKHTITVSVTCATAVVCIYLAPLFPSIT